MYSSFVCKKQPTIDVLFPIQHGVLYYPGFDVLPPYVVYRTSRVDDGRFAAIREDVAPGLAGFAAHVA